MTPEELLKDFSYLEKPDIGDANLPPRLYLWLRSRQHQAEHLLERNLLTATRQRDLGDWQAEALTIFSKDIDFYDRAVAWSSAANHPRWTGQP
jgi:hypothetical protein